MLRPMIPLTIDIAILDKLTRNTCFESNALSCHAAQSTQQSIVGDSRVGGEKQVVCLGEER